MNEKDYIRVSTILGLYTDFSKIKPNVLDYAAKRGTKIHNLCAAHAQNIWIPSVPEDCKRYFDSFRNWFAAQVVRVIYVEKRFYNSVYFYSGQVDFILEMRTEGVVLVDLKTPIQHYPTWAGQLAAYLNLEIPVKIKKAGSLQLNPHGKTAKMNWYENSPQDFAQFLHALSAYRFFKERKK